MHLQTTIFLILASIVLFFLFRKKSTAKTESIGIAFSKEIPTDMSAPTTTTATTNDGSPLYAQIVPQQASGATSSGVVSAVSATLSDTSVGTATVKTSTSGATYIEFDTLKVGVTTLTVTCTVTDTDGAAATFTATATLTVTPGPNDTVTASIELTFSSTVPA